MDWLKVDVHTLLAPWVDRVVSVFGLQKKPAKYLVTYVIARLAIPQTQSILTAVADIFENPENFQRQYLSRLNPSPPQTELLTNAAGLRPTNPRQVNFMDLVDYWAVPLNRDIQVPIVQARDVTKIALVFFLEGNDQLMAGSIEALVQERDSALFMGEGVVTFPPLSITTE
jgi:hypothetical protein